MEAYKKSPAYSAHKDSAPSSGKKTKKEGPKKPITAFMAFSSAMRASVKEKNPSASFGEIAKIVGQDWKNLSESEKNKYNKLVDEDKKRYERELANFKPSEKAVVSKVTAAKKSAAKPKPVIASESSEEDEEMAESGDEESESSVESESE